VNITVGTPAGVGAYGNIILSENGGRVGIATASPLDTLHIAGNIRGGTASFPNARRYEITSASGNTVLQLYNGAQTENVRLHTSGDSFITQDLGLGGNKSPNVALDVSGDIEYTGTLTDVSDRRLKTDITPLSQNGSILERISQIDTYSFVMKDDADKRTEFGVIAQELEPIFPELVHTADDEIGTKSVNYVGLIAPMIEATKELRAENLALKAEIAALKTAQKDTDAKLTSIDEQVKLLSKISAANTVDQGSMQSLLILLLGLMMGGAMALIITRKNHNA
jgi:hypothetical protein